MICNSDITSIIICFTRRGPVRYKYQAMYELGNLAVVNVRDLGNVKHAFKLLAFPDTRVFQCANGQSKVRLFFYIITKVVVVQELVTKHWPAPHTLLTNMILKVFLQKLTTRCLSRPCRQVTPLPAPLASVLVLKAMLWAHNERKQAWEGIFNTRASGHTGGDVHTYSLYKDILFRTSFRIVR